MEYVRPEISTLDTAYEGLDSSAGAILVVVAVGWAWAWYGGP
jgi:hypothetical protein